MKLRKAMKKIVALGTGMTMLGATLFGATAADLADYPSPLFIKDGKFDGIVVVGDAAASQDVIGAVDIAMNLQFESKSETTVSTSGTKSQTVVEGDAFKLAKSGDPLNYGELVNNPVQTATDDNLNALAEGSISNQKGTFKYSQFIDVANDTSVMYAVDSDISEDPALYLNVPADSRVYTYKVSFPTSLESDDDAGELDDIENKKITLLGKEYTIISATYAAPDVTLELLGGDVQDTIQEYSSKTYTLNGVDYEVEVIAIGGDPTTVILKINGEVTDKLGEGETHKLNDGTEIGVKTLLDNEGTESGGGDIVEFYLGSAKVTLEDDIGSDTTGDLEVGDEDMEAIVDISGSVSGTDVSISEIEIYYNAAEEFNIPVGGKLSEALDDDDKGNLFLNNVDYEFAGVDSPATEDIKVKGNKNDVVVTLTTKTGGEFSFDAFYRNAGAVPLGESATKPLVVDAAVNVTEKQYFVLSSGKYSHLMQLDGFKDTKVKFKDIASGDVIEQSAGGCDGDHADQHDLILDGKTYTFSADCTNKWVNFTSFGTDTDNMTAVLYTKQGAKVMIGTNGTTGYVGVFEEERQDQNEQDYSVGYNVTIVSDGSEIDISGVSGAVAGYTVTPLDWESKEDIATVYSQYGSYIEYDSDSYGSVDIMYPDDELEFAVYLTSGVTSTSTVGGGDGGSFTTTKPNEIGLGAAKLASEVSNIASQNMIVVGGPCANAIAAQLMGNPSPCTAGFEEGKAIIKLYENGNKVAMLVAGATALDTRRASRVLADYDQYSLSGMEVEVKGTSTTFSDTVVSAVTEG